MKNTHSDIDSILIDYWDALNRIAQTHSSQQSLEEALQRNSQALEDSLLALLGATSDEEPVERDALSQMTPGIARGNPMTAGGGVPHIRWITTKSGKRIPISDGEAGGGGMRPDGSAAAGGPGGPPAEPQFEKAKIKGWDVDLPPIPEPLMNAIGPNATEPPLTGAQIVAIIRAYMDATRPADDFFQGKVTDALGVYKRDHDEAALQALTDVILHYNRFRVARTEKIRELLVVRTPINAVLRYITPQPRKVRTHMDAALEQFNTLVERDALRGGDIFVRTATGTKTYYNNNTIFVSPRDCHPTTIIHYMGHWAEENDPELLQSALKFYHTKTKGHSPSALGEGYAPNEKIRRSDFRDPYMGKDYDGKATEITSMGLEYFFCDPGTLAIDNPDVVEQVYDSVRNRSSE